VFICHSGLLIQVSSFVAIDLAVEPFQQRDHRNNQAPGAMPVRTHVPDHLLRHPKAIEHTVEGAGAGIDPFNP
jgi:hypothetical protein